MQNKRALAQISFQIARIRFFYFCKRGISIDYKFW